MVICGVTQFVFSRYHRPLRVHNIHAGRESSADPKMSAVIFVELLEAGIKF